MKRTLLLLALSSATLVEYDQELVEFICRFYLDSPPFSIARDDKSSAWTRLVLTLPTVYTSHARLGATRDFTVCRGLRDVFLFTPAARDAGVPCAAVVDRADAPASAARSSPSACRRPAGSASGPTCTSPRRTRCASRRRSKTGGPRAPRRSGARTRAGSSSRGAPAGSRLAPGEMERVARHLRRAFASENLLLAPASPTLDDDVADGAAARRPPFAIPDERGRAHARARGERTRTSATRCCSRASRAAFVVTEAAGINLLAHYFTARHVTLATPPAYVGAAALGNLGGSARLAASPAELLAALEEMTPAAGVAAAAAADAVPAPASPAGRDLATLRGRAIAARSPFAPRSDVPAVVCDALTPWAQKAPFNGEFGPELVTALPHAYFLHACGKLRATSSCGDLSDFYWFSPRHVAKECVRRAGLWSHEGILGSYAGANAITWLPPPLRARVRDTRADIFAGRFGAATPRITIFNRIDCPADYRPRPGVTEPHHVCKPYLGTYDLDQILAKIYTYAPRASVAYHRSDAALAMKGFSPERWNVMADGGGGGAASNGTAAAARALACPRTKKFGCVSARRSRTGPSCARTTATSSRRATCTRRRTARDVERLPERDARVERLLHLAAGRRVVHRRVLWRPRARRRLLRKVVRGRERRGAAAPPSRRRLYENAATCSIVLGGSQTRRSDRSRLFRTSSRGSTTGTRKPLRSRLTKIAQQTAGSSSSRRVAFVGSCSRSGRGAARRAARPRAGPAADRKAPSCRSRADTCSPRARPRARRRGTRARWAVGRSAASPSRRPSRRRCTSRRPRGA